MKKKTLLFLLFLTWAPLLWSQKYVTHFLSTEDGLSQNTIEGIVQDAKGFVWIGTSYGLNRYDSQTFEAFQNIPYDSTSLSCSKINDLLVDQQQQLWIANCRGLDIYNYKTGHFQSVYFQLDDQRLKNKLTDFLFEDPSGNIWISNSSGLWRMEKGIPTEQNHLSGPQLILDRTIYDTYVSAMTVDEKGRYWIAFYSRGLFCFEWKKGQLVEVERYFAEENSSFDSHTIFDLYKDYQSRIWIGTIDGLAYINPGSNKLNYLEEAGKATIYHFCEEAKNQLLVGSRKGIFRLNLSEEQPKIDRAIFEQTDFNSINEKLTIIEIRKDIVDDHLFWLATPNSGVLRLEKRVNDLRPVKLKSFKTNSSVSYLVQQDQKVYLDLPDTVLVHDLSTDSIWGWEYIQTNEGILSTTRLNNFFIGEQGQLWAGTWDGSLLLFEQLSGKRPRAQIFHRENDSGFLLSFLEQGDYLYIGTFQRGIWIFDKKKKRFKEESILLETSKERHDISVTKMLIDQQNNLWVGTWEGLFLFRNISDSITNLKAVKPEVYIYDENNIQSIPNHEIQDLFEDKEGTVWVATSHGLLKTTLKENSIHFDNFTTDHGLPNNHICAIETEAGQQHLWVTTRNGLCRFNRETKKADNFFPGDGCQGLEFNIFSSFQNDKGELLFGGVKGYNRFYPGDIQLRTPALPIYLTKLNTPDGKEFDLLLNKKVKLDYQQNSFSLQFVALNFREATGYQFAYELNDDKASRTIIQGPQQINFHKLPPGDYRLKVLALKNEMPYGEAMDEINIIVSRPFWLHPFFYVFLAISFFALSFFILNWQYQQRLEKIRVIEQVRKNAAADFHDELGSKLTIITLHSRLLQGELGDLPSHSKNYLQKITSTSNQLIQAMRDLLWSLNPDHDSVHDLFIQIKDFGEQLFDYTEIEFHSEGLRSPMKDIKLPMESQRHCLLIFKEAMNNSLRHAQAKNVYFSIQTKAHQLTISVRDDGKGFEARENNDGNGLKNMQNRAVKIAALIDIKNSSEGTQIDLTISLSKHP